MKKDTRNLVILGGGFAGTRLAADIERKLPKDWDIYLLNRTNEPGELRFDQLVLATGVEANTSLLPGMHEHALPLKTVGDALRLRNIAIERLEQATIHPQSDRRRQLLHFTVIGGGFSGVEIAGELEDFLKSATRYYKNVDPDDVHITLLHGTDTLLPELSRKLGKKTQLLFEKRRIDVRLNTRAARIEPGEVILASGERIGSGTIICTIGTAPTTYNQVA
ncbi:NAD(P)/FAD-dependent oxidoreductase [Chromatocurvus halotolerans]|uniref:NADH:ubiquinone reductase (non-electrogenic) n=1 Tax=Chromatocurvus halotolerans TaxID=1132028 RepID=A0A4R2KVA8_9GAMM|nr:FAD-dependent oxidoreductase [Chromatocurvus halotolerans]TCO77864.1 pyridine nucleotide-disulfide oxidoreductase [Chromatocurvus halotolerans]